MFKHFIPAEFYKFSFKSWLQQFEYAINLIQSHPNTALMYLVDTDYERWKSICDHIDNIDRVAVAIEFLGNSLDTNSCQTQYHRIEQVIQVAKLAALERRNVKLLLQIKDAQDNQKMLSVNLEILDTKIEQLKYTINELKKRLKTLSAKQRSTLATLQREIVQIYQQRMKVKVKVDAYQSEINILQRHLIAIQPFGMEHSL
jgi:predicted RNase H-like nuclease (RuvC/YqgF family)